MKLPTFSSISKIGFTVFAVLSSLCFETVECRLGENKIQNNNNKNILFDDYYQPFEKANQLSQINSGMCDVLVLSGGGSFGAVEIGILADLVSKGKVKTQFDILTGISAGGLNAGFLSFYNNISQAIPYMETIYSSLSNDDIYKRDLLKIGSEWSIYNTEPLQKTLHKYIDGKKRQMGSPVTIIGASNILDHTLDVFRFDNLDDNDKVDVLMATSAIPIVFPPHIINGTYYVDGGLISNEMIFEALGVRDCDYYKFVFISASSHEKDKGPINGLFSYISSVLHLLYDTFDYQLSEFANQTCDNPKGVIKACFPNSTQLENYSILDFDYGSDLINIGKNNYFCADIDLC